MNVANRCFLRLNNLLGFAALRHSCHRLDNDRTLREESSNFREGKKEKEEANFYRRRGEETVLEIEKNSCM